MAEAHAHELQLATLAEAPAAAGRLLRLVVAGGKVTGIVALGCPLRVFAPGRARFGPAALPLFGFGLRCGTSGALLGLGRYDARGGERRSGYNASSSQPSKFAAGSLRHKEGA